MPRYRKKPIIIEAIQWTGKNLSEITAFMPTGFLQGEAIAVPTLEGTMMASPGDYLIRGIRGEFYPCKADIFLKTYDLVETDGRYAQAPGEGSPPYGLF
jgi:energy-converting hydrogenase Eha subunit B